MLAVEIAVSASIFLLLGKVPAALSANVVAGM